MPLSSHPDLSGLLDLLLDMVCAVAPDGTFSYVSAACEQLLGYTREEMQGRLMLDFVHPDDRQRTLDAARHVAAGQQQSGFENRYLHKDGRVVHLMWTARWSGRDLLRVAVARDITARKRSENLQTALYRISEAVHRSGDVAALCAEVHQSLALLLPASGCCVVLADAGGERHAPYCARAASPAGESPAAVPQALAEAVWSKVQQQGEALPAEGWLGVPLRNETRVIGVLAVQSGAGAAPYTRQDAELLQIVASQVAAAIERKRFYERQEYLALHDPLTGLPNRRLFDDRLHEALKRGRRNGTRFALLYLDLDRFKQVNDALGHAAGDQLLQQVAERLLQRVRGSDTVARLGGDEFVLLLEGLGTDDVLPLLCDKVRTAFAQPFRLDAGELLVTPSIGLALYPDDGSDGPALLAHADGHMYGAKHQSGS